MNPAALLTALIIAEESGTRPGSPPPVTFLVTVIFAAAVILLGFDLVRRIRRAQFKAEIDEKLANEQAERDSRAAGDRGPGVGGTAPSDVEAGPDAGRSVDPDAGSAGPGDDAATQA